MDSEPEPMMEINTTPLIDVMLVLLVMLIITIPIQLHTLSLDTRGSTPPRRDMQPEPVKIDIDERSVVHWNGEPLAGRDELQARMAAAAALPVQPQLRIQPHQAARYERFVEVMASAHRAGLVKLGVAGSEQFAAPR